MYGNMSILALYPHPLQPNGIVVISLEFTIIVL